MPSSSSKSNPKPSEVASEAKRYYIPLIRKEYAAAWATSSYIYHQPLLQINFLERPADLAPPHFCEHDTMTSQHRQLLRSNRNSDVYNGDPVDFAVSWVAQAQCAIPFICAANDKRPGGDWETGVVGYEERLCRRSTLAACLATPGEGSSVNNHYPIPICAGILSRDVGQLCSPYVFRLVINLCYSCLPWPS
jgi:hypothetical protein